MFKLVVLFAVLAIVSAKPTLLTPVVHSAAIVGSVPTSISEHSTSIVHDHALVSPVVRAAPLLHAAPIVQTYVDAPAVVSTHGVIGHSLSLGHAGLVW